jgi:hypothetical protein
LQSEHRAGVFVALLGQLVDVRVVGDDLLDQVQIEGQQPVGGAGHRLAHQTAHHSQVGAELFELAVKDLPHRSTLEPAAPA